MGEFWQCKCLDDTIKIDINTWAQKALNYDGG
jgi:hypothetical protein